MKMNTRKWTCILILGLILCPLKIAAHDMWLEKSKDGYSVTLGHKGQADTYDPARVQEAIGYTESGWPVKLRIERGQNGCNVFTDESFCTLTAVLDNEYWLKTTDGWKNQRDKKGLEIVEQGHSFKYTKHIEMWSGFLNKPLGQRFEIVPLKDPTTLKPGDKLPVKVFFEGKLCRNAKVSKSSKMTDTHALEDVQGEDPFMVEIGPSGLQLVNAKFGMPVKGNQKVWFACSLTFYGGK
jgi:nickel transport protein